MELAFQCTCGAGGAARDGFNPPARVNPQLLLEAAIEAAARDSPAAPKQQRGTHLIGEGELRATLDGLRVLAGQVDVDDLLSGLQGGGTCNVKARSIYTPASCSDSDLIQRPG